MNAGNCGRTLRWSFLALALLGLLAPGARLHAAAAVPGVIPGLEPEAAQKLDPLLWMALSAERAAAARGESPSHALAILAIGAENGAAGPTVDLLIQVQDELAGMRPALAVPITAMIGRIATATAVPIARVADLARDPQVARIAPARRYHPMNDVSVPETGAPAAWTEFDTKGSGAIVAIIDTGIDPEHPDFELPNGNTRIQYLLDLSRQGSGPFGGTLFSAADINAGLADPDTGDPVGHGTHVAGSAAGSGQADSTFRGVAPEADLIIVNADRNGIGAFSTADIVNSLAFVDERAAALEKPYVANLSLGGHDGAHDGTALEEIAIDDLVGPGIAGKAVVIAAGNEASGPARHAAAEVNGGEHSFTILVPPNYQPAPGTGNDIVVMNIWYESSSDFQLTLTPPGGAPLGPFPAGTSNGDGSFIPQGAILIENAVNGSDPENGDRQALIILADFPTPPAGGTWTFTLEGDVGHFDAYIAQSSIFGPTGQPVEFSTDVQLGGFVAEPGTSRNAITVGAYVSKLQWTDLDQFDHDLRDFFLGLQAGARAPFSNIGPTRDGRLKPEIAAPGMIIGSCFSHDAPPGSPTSSFNSPFPQDFPNFFILNKSYGLQQGTSQASPHVAGAVALIFSLHPDWDIMDVRQALTATAREDQHTGPSPNYLFGYGKLDVLEALRLAETPGSLPGDVTGDNEVDIKDAQLTIQFVLETADYTPQQGRLADMNRDGSLDVTDVVLIVRTALATGGVMAALPAADQAPAAGSFILPVTIDSGEHVAGIDVQLLSPSHRPDAAAASATGDRVLALGAPGRDAGSARVIALALDGSNLAGRQVIQLPFQAVGSHPPSAKDWTAARVMLIAPGGKRVAGTVKLGQPFAARATPAALRVTALGPEPAPGARAIAFDLPAFQGDAAGESAALAPAKVRVGIYDAGGRLVRELAHGYYEPGRHELNWDGRGPRGSVAAGAYWVRVEAGGEIATSRLTVLK